MFKLKSKLIVAVMIISGITTFMSCEKEIDNKNVISQNSIEKTEFEKIGKLHNIGLSHNIEAFNKIKNKSAFYNKSGIDTLALINFLEEESLKFLENHSIEFQGEQVVCSQLPITLSNEQKIESIRNMYSMEYYISNNQNLNKYINEIRQAIGNISDSTILINKLNHIDILIENDNSLNEEERVILFSMISVGVNSYLYWSKRTNGLKDGVSTGIVLADVTGAGSGALWGSVAGPLGSILMGLSGALINSSTAYIIDEAL